MRKPASAFFETSFAGVIADWDGTMVPDRSAVARDLRSTVEELVRYGVHIIVVSGTNVENVGGQLAVRPSGSGSLHLCLNRGSEVYRMTRKGPLLLERRTASDFENRALDSSAEATVARLEEAGLQVRLIRDRLNRRKIDLLPIPEWDAPSKARIGELLAAVSTRLLKTELHDLAGVVALARSAAVAAGLVDARVTTDVKHVEIGLTDTSDSARWSAVWLAERGVTGELIVLAGDEFGPVGGTTGSDSLMLVPELARAAVVSVGAEPEGCPGVTAVGGGPARFQELLELQVSRHRARRVPSIDRDPAWTLSLSVGAGDRSAGALTAIANGACGTRGGAEEDAASLPLFVANGVYTSPPDPTLLPGPLWSVLDIDGPTTDRLVHLDLRSGVLLREGPGDVRTMRFVSAARPSIVALRAEGRQEILRVGPALASPTSPVGFEVSERNGDQLARTVGKPDGGGIALAARQLVTVDGGRRTIERIAAWTAMPRSVPSWNGPTRELSAASEDGFESLLADHRRAWAARWADATVTIDGDDPAQLGARFAVFHLLSSARGGGSSSVGARGLTGEAYGGHVFWDADVFVLPVLAAIDPAAARSMLEYRVRGLPAARSLAGTHGHDGARFPWESAGDGTDVTPRWGTGIDGHAVEILTGSREEHISADVAWAADHYASWTGDRAFLGRCGRTLICDTARYWASRIERDADGTAHLRGVMGPDEYHEVVDDNMFTNVMVRWNLRRAADLVHRAEPALAERWSDIANALVDGYDPDAGRHEQFAGYWQLEELVARSVHEPPFAADLLLGAARCARSQLIKQADVVMAHHLLPDELPPGSLEQDIEYYLPRCCHGSSLSPGVHAAQLARAGRVQEARDLFQLATDVSLRDLSGTTSGGVQLAGLGGVWQALAYGFLGLRPRAQSLKIDPRLPREWRALELTFRFRGQRLTVRAEQDVLFVRCEHPLVTDHAGRQVRCEAGLTRIPRS